MLKIHQQIILSGKLGLNLINLYIISLYIIKTYKIIYTFTYKIEIRA